MAGKDRFKFDHLNTNLAFVALALLGVALLEGCAPRQEMPPPYIAPPPMGMPPVNAPPAEMGMPPAGGPAPQMAMPPPQEPYPVMEQVAQRVIEHYQTSSCETLYEERSQPPTGQRAQMEQRAVQMLRDDPQLRAQFLDRVAAPIANRLFECGLIP